jgi:predicted transcriptional regulator
MSNKEKILSVIQSLPDEASIDEAIDRLYLLWKIERGIEQADAGQVTDHDEFMRELLDGED